MQARLKVLHDKANVKQVKLLPVTLIGRSTECNLKIASSQVSRNHCRITLGTDAVFIEDLGSANGTLVDGQPLTAHQPTAIAPGAQLVVGPARFQIDYVASTSATMILARTSIPRAPDLSSTEMIFPAPVVPAPKPEDMEQASSPTVRVAPSTAIETVFAPPAPAVPVADPVSATKPIVAAPVVAVPVTIPIAAPVPPSSAAAAPVPAVVPIPSAPMAPAPEALDPEVVEESADFDFFQEDSVSAEAPELLTEDADPEPAPESSGQKDGKKGWFSIFGRKQKSAAAAQSGNSSPLPAATPSVFLPTVEAPPATAPEPVAVEVDVADATGEIETVEPTNGKPVSSESPPGEFAGDDTTETATDSDEGFQQFLAQF